MEVIVKTVLKKSDSSVEVRRIPLNVKTLEDCHGDGLLETLMSQIAKRFSSLNNKTFDLTWKDSEGDCVMMSSDAELREALASMKGHILKLYVTVRGGEASQAKASTSTDQTTAMAPCGQAAESDHSSARKGFKGHLTKRNGRNCDRKTRILELRSQVPIGHRRWAKGYIRRWREENVESATTTSGSDVSGGEKSSKVRQQRANVPAVYAQWMNTILPRMHQRWAGQDPGKFEDGFDEIKTEVPTEFRRWCRCYLKRRFGSKDRSETMTESDNEDRQCPSKNRSAKVMEPSTDSAQSEDQTCLRNIKSTPYTSLTKSETADDRTCHRGRWKTMDKKELKTLQRTLKSQVPIGHRRWAKGYIRQWREENDESTTTTSGSDVSDGEKGSKIRQQRVNVPAVYAQWMDTILPRMHQRWAGQKAGKFEDGFDEIKAGVLMEFKRWCRCYLKRRFGPKDESETSSSSDNEDRKCSRKRGSAKLKTQVPEDLDQTCHRNSKLDKSDMSKDKKCLTYCWATMDKKELRALQKTLKGNVPIEHRIWTKQFISQWCQDHVTSGNERLQNNSSGGESDAAEREVTTKEIPIPADYEKWLRKLLNRIHGKMAIPLIVADDGMVKGCMGQFKDTVPLEYRKWVKCYIHRRFSMDQNTGYNNDNNDNTLDSTQGQPQPPRPRHTRNLYLQRTLASQKQWLPWILAFLEKWSEFQEPGEGTGQGDKDQSSSARQPGEDFDKDQDQDQEQDQDQTFTKLNIPPKVLRWMRKAAAREQNRGNNKQESKKANTDKRNPNAMKTKNYTFKYV